MSKLGDLRLQGIHQGRLLLGPETLHVDLSNGCNLACATCWDHSPLLRRPRPAAWKRLRADAGQVLALLDDALQLGGLRAVVFSGQGEPLTHPGALELVRQARSRGLRVALITNLLAGEARALAACEADELLVGVHAASAPVYEALHPGCSAGAFEDLLRRLDSLAAAGRRGDKHVQVICAANAHELPAMVRLARRHGCGRVTFKLASLGGGTEAQALTPELRQGLARRWLPEARQEAARLDVSCNLEVLEAQLSAGGQDTAPIEAVGCFMGYAYARVLVDGTVLFCCADDIVVGSLSEACFSALWRGPRWEALRRRLRDGQYFPGCRRCGKLNQNIKLARRFAALFGEERRRAVTGAAP